MEKKRRLQAALSEQDEQSLKKISDLFGASTESQVIRDIIMCVETLAESMSPGDKLFIKSADGSLREIIVPLLIRAARNKQ